jgi:hypothetical protein
MKRFATYLLLAFCCLTGLTVLAQPVLSKRDKIDALRVTFINEKVNFTTAESQAFWPLYNEYNDKLDLARKTFRQQYVKDIDFTTLSDKEAEGYLSAELSLKQKEYELYKEYFEKFKKVLPVKKVAILRRAEEEFRREMIKNIKANSPEK